MHGGHVIEKLKMASMLEDSDCSGVDLLTIKEAFNFRSYVKDNLMDNSIYGSFDYDETISQSAKIIGQERNSNILVSWDAPIDGTTNKIVTHVGIYSPLSPSHRTLYTHNEQIDICGATVDTDKTLLAFTIRERQPIGLNYDTYVAEICPCNRVFSLNISSTDFRKLLFAHNKSKQPTTAGYAKAKRTSRLLVVIPDNWICQYSFQLESIERGFTVVCQPSRSLIVNDLAWYQWDPQRQWLSYGRFSAASAGPMNNMLIINVIDFGSQPRSVILTFSVPLSCSIAQFTSSTSYFANSLAFTHPVHELNMKVCYKCTTVHVYCNLLFLTLKKFRQHKE